MNGCKINYLDLYNWGHSLFSNWKENRYLLENILIGIEECDNMINSLKKVNLSYVKSIKDQEILEKVIEKYSNLDHIEFELS